MLALEIDVDLVAAANAAIPVRVVWVLLVMVVDSVYNVANAPVRFRYIRHIIYYINFLGKGVWKIF